MSNVMILLDAVVQFLGSPILSGLSGGFATLGYWASLGIMLGISASVIRTLLDS